MLHWQDQVKRLRQEFEAIDEQGTRDTCVVNLSNCRYCLYVRHFQLVGVVTQLQMLEIVTKTEFGISKDHIASVMIPNCELRDTDARCIYTSIF